MSANKNVPEKILSPMMCWDIYAMYLQDQKEEAKKVEDLRSLGKLHRQYRWKVELKSILAKSYEALVVTDAQQIISWVNEGFTKMTGYPASFALGRRPLFLQGSNTSLESKERIRKNIGQKIHFSEDIINYRKDGEEYICHVEIHPIYNYQNELTHFLALESEAIAE